MSVARGRDKEDTVHIHITEYYSAIKKKKVGLFVEMWLGLESDLQTEISQKEKTNIVYQYIYRI